MAVRSAPGGGALALVGQGQAGTEGKFRGDVWAETKEKARAAIWEARAAIRERRTLSLYLAGEGKKP